MLLNKKFLATLVSAAIFGGIIDSAMAMERSTNLDNRRESSHDRYASLSRKAYGNNFVATIAENLQEKESFELERRSRRGRGRR